MRCPGCDHPEDPQARFCTACGAALTRSWAQALDGDAAQSWILGRGQAADLRLEGPEISARHLRLSREGGRWLATDLGSTNGSFVDGRRLPPGEPVAVAPFAELRLGSTTLTAAALAAALRERLIEAEEGRELVVGRAPGCDLRLDSPTLSPRHAALRRSAAGWRIRDLGSRAGTRVNGERLRAERLLRPGDRVELGGLRLDLDGARLKAVDLRRSLHLDVVDLGLRARDGAALLREVNLAIAPGELVYLMGPSGAGKSTLLRAMAGVAAPSEGAVRVNGVDLHHDGAHLAGLLGWVSQDLVLPERLSARRVLRDAAALRLPPDAVDEQVRHVVQALGLTGCEDLPVTGLSGGQRRRVHLGVELLAEPGALFLDEPCSGLDARSGLAMLRLARALADGGKPVVVTLHQPRVEALELADHVALLARGRLCWFGPPAELSAFMAAEGLTGPGHALATPTDRAVDALDPGPGLAEDAAARWAGAYARAEARRRWVQARRAEPPEGPRAAPAPPGGDGLQLAVLTRRRMALLAADRGGLALLAVQAPALGALIVALFGDQRFLWMALPVGPLKPVDQVSPALFLMASAMLWLGCNNAARELVQERALFLRERRWGLGVLPALASAVTAQFLLVAAQAGVLTAAAAWMSMIQLGRLWVTLTLTGWAGAAMGLALSAFARTRAAAVFMVPLVVLPQIMLGGLVVPYGDLSPGLAFVADHLVPLRSAFDALALLELPHRMGGPFRLAALGLVDLSAPPPWNHRLPWVAAWAVLPLALAGWRLRREAIGSAP